MDFLQFQSFNIYFRVYSYIILKKKSFIMYLNSLNSKKELKFFKIYTEISMLLSKIYKLKIF